MIVQFVLSLHLSKVFGACSAGLEATFVKESLQAASNVELFKFFFWELTLLAPSLDRYPLLSPELLSKGVCSMSCRANMFLSLSPEANIH